MLVRTRLLIAPLVAAPLMAAGLLTGAAPASAASGQVVKDTVAITVAPDGTLQVKETVIYEGAAPARTLIRRKHLDDRQDRRYDVGDVKGGTLTNQGDRAVLRVSGGGGAGRRTAQLSYTVKGTMTTLRTGEQLNWVAAGGWHVPAAQTRVTVDSSAVVQNLNCFAGDLSSTIGCTQFFTNHTHTQAEFRQEDLQPGEYVTVMVGYPLGTAKGSPIIEQRHTVTTAFTVNGLTGGTLLGLLVLLLGGVGLLYVTRGRDARIVNKKAAEGDHAPLDSAGFAPPDGVRPGQIGTLIDEQADVVDVTATIIDLAVRGYILIEELPRETYGRIDWQLRRLRRAPDDLLPYERILYDALFNGRDVVALSELGGTFADQLAAVRSALYEDVVRQGWFARRPDSERTRWTSIGMILAGLGVIGTIVLAVYTNLALIGLAVIIAGAALAVGGQYMPAKTTRGATVLAHTLGFRAHLFRGDVPDAPAGHRVALFSHYLPYAVVFDVVQSWAHTVADVGAGNSGPSDNLYWYEGPAEWDLSNFAESIRSFTLATSGAISASRQFRSLS
ncbi:DUF2207 domain-containing protein [Actinoallomurus rhizosphaericola]|uniref:DUF2207 domain-containing protein n=1 Tax=Actinoallomurus rhizosphaericola TaxID=2952536 RepID=UPI00209293B3|nr:DUF2207 domain-containing protein [Actinoallomurus rhizosphaericola]MCO5996094.1 DUF2207 domain-containing protein [Actinoallomurus rhizosphaericola]